MRNPRNGSERQVPANMLTLEQAADMLGTTVNTVNWYVSVGKLGRVLDHWRLGWMLRRRRLIPKEELLRFIAARAASGSYNGMKWKPATG